MLTFLIHKPILGQILIVAITSIKSTTIPLNIALFCVNHNTHTIYTAIQMTCLPLHFLILLCKCPAKCKKVSTPLLCSGPTALVHQLIAFHTLQEKSHEKKMVIGALTFPAAKNTISITVINQHFSPDKNLLQATYFVKASTQKLKIFMGHYISKAKSLPNKDSGDLVKWVRIQQVLRLYLISISLMEIYVANLYLPNGRI